MLSKPYIFFGILEFHLSLEFTLTFNRFVTQTEHINKQKLGENITAFSQIFSLFQMPNLHMKRSSSWVVLFTTSGGLFLFYTG